MNGTNKSADTRPDIHRYDDIIHLPHHVSPIRPQMSLHDRAAQFAPFAALTGYDAAVKETARLTDRRMELDENTKVFLDEKLRILQEQSAGHPKAAITYFQPDERKAGGSYVKITGEVKKLDSIERQMILCDGRKIPIDDVIGIESELFRFLQEDFE